MSSFDTEFHEKPLLLSLVFDQNDEYPQTFPSLWLGPLSRGCTCKDEPQVRRHNLAQCYKNAKLLAFTDLIPHAYRVERLVHADLAKQRRKDECNTCRTNHSEWFEVARDLAVQVVARWAAWLASQPYDQDSGRLSSIWEERLTHRLVVSLRPAVDHFVSKVTDLAILG